MQICQDLNNECPHATNFIFSMSQFERVLMLFFLSEFCLGARLLLCTIFSRAKLFN